MNFHHLSRFTYLACLVPSSILRTSRPRPVKTLHGLLAAIFLMALSATSKAEVIDLKTRDSQIRLLIEGPANPSHVVALFTGGRGAVELRSDGSIGKGRGNFAVRTRTMLQARGMATVVVAAPDDNRNLRGNRDRDNYAIDVGNVIGYLRSTFSRPIWLHGTSRGTNGIVLTLPKIKDASKKPDGIVLSSSITKRNKYNSVFDAKLDEITGPVLVLHHREDPCRVTPSRGVKTLMKALIRAAPKKAILFTGGGQNTRGRKCGAKSKHGFIDIEQQVIKAMAGFIKNPG